MTTRLPVLESLRIATPCNADWDDMKGDEAVRFCGKCEKNVYNLSALSRAEAESLVQEREGRLCVRLYQRADGTVLTSDCPVGVQKKRLRQRVWASISGAAASLMLVFGVWSGRASADLTLQDGKKHPAQTHVLMGGPMPSPPPRHVLMGKPSFEAPSPAAKKKKPMVMMGDVSAE
jgi:hypothetical protein